MTSIVGCLFYCDAFDYNILDWWSKLRVHVYGRLVPAEGSGDR